MRAGELRHRITIQEKLVAQDEFGAEVVTWSDWATVWAKVETVSGDEFIAQQQAGAMVTHKVTIRALSDLLPTMQIVWGDRTLLIHAILPDNRQRETVLMCSEAAIETTPFVVGSSFIGGSGVVS